MTAVDAEKVAAYIRWSTEEQGEGTTLGVQREACEHYIRSQGWCFRPELLFVDDGYSGGSLERPGLAALRRAVAAGEVTCVVVYKLDRLSRSVLDLVNLILQEWDGLCFVRSTREPVDTTSPTGKMFFYTLASFAEWERSVIRERTMAGKARRAQEGKNPGFAYPFGYRPGETPGAWAVDAAEAAVVRRIFREYLHGRGLGTIAEGLNREGIRSRRGARWDPTRIACILRNPSYTGVLQYGMSARVPQAARRRPGRSLLRFEQPRYARVEGALPVIITAEEFAAVQAIREQKGAVRGKRALAPQYLLSGIARCRCGASLRAQAEAGPGRLYRYYRCANDRPGARGECDCALIPAEAVERLVVGRLKAEFAPGQRARLLASLAQQLAAQRTATEQALQAAQAALGGLQQRRRRLDQAFDAGELSGRLYNSRVEALAAEEEALCRALLARRREIEALRSAPVDPARYDRLIARLDVWESLDLAEQKQVLRFLVDRLTVYRRRLPSRRATAQTPLEVEVHFRRSAPSTLVPG